MFLTNLKDSSDTASFQQALIRGLGKHQGLYFPTEITPLSDVNSLLNLPLAERSVEILAHLLGDEIPRSDLATIVHTAFNFDAKVVPIDERVYCFELFHGPTLAFKDFGGRFMAQCLVYACPDQKITILTATSGDTGAAVAQAFHGIDNINVVILFPKGKISPLQEKLFTTLGDNIHTFAVDGDFDACQALVKTAFDDPDVRDGLNLNSANSINISRLLAQVCYYFEAVAQLPEAERARSVFSVPSGNFGNLTAGMIAKLLGLPIKRFVAATNINDTVPRFLRSGSWDPKTTAATISNAMDVSRPNNWPRIQAMLDRQWLSTDNLSSEAIDEDTTQIAMKKLASLGYVSEPHAAVGYRALMLGLEDDEVGVFLGTAHPAKFKETVENILGNPLALPEALARTSVLPSLAEDISAEYEHLKAAMLSKLSV